MKTLKYSFGLLLSAVVLLSSCRDFEDPNVPYKDFDTGAYLRTIARTSMTFNFFNLESANFALTIEAVDIEDGATVETVEIRVRHRRLIPGVGLEYTPASDVLIKTLQSSDFGPNSESRFLRNSFTIPATEAISAVGLTLSDIEGGDVFEFRLVLFDKKGRRFSTDNVTTNIAGAPFYDSPFQYFVNVVCPSQLAGTYNYSTTNGSAYGDADDLQDNVCPGPLTGTVTLAAVANAAGSYSLTDATFGVWECAGDPQGKATGVRLVDSCGKLSFSGQDQYNGAYTLGFVSNNGQELVFTWSNVFGEKGTVTLFANEGSPWPDNLH